MEIAFDAFSQGHTAITMDFIHDPLWKERREVALSSILKDLEKHLGSVRAVADNEDTTDTTP